jgi:hypothetical protein
MSGSLDYQQGESSRGSRHGFESGNDGSDDKPIISYSLRDSQPTDGTLEYCRVEGGNPILQSSSYESESDEISSQLSYRQADTFGGPITTYQQADDTTDPDLYSRYFNASYDVGDRTIGSEREYYPRQVESVLQNHHFDPQYDSWAPREPAGTIESPYPAEVEINSSGLEPIDSSPHQIPHLRLSPATPENLPDRAIQFHQQLQPYGYHYSEYEGEAQRPYKSFVGLAPEQPSQQQHPNADSGDDDVYIEPIEVNYLPSPRAAEEPVDFVTQHQQSMGTSNEADERYHPRYDLSMSQSTQNHRASPMPLDFADSRIITFDSPFQALDLPSVFPSSPPPPTDEPHLTRPHEQPTVYNTGLDEANDTFYDTIEIDFTHENMFDLDSNVSSQAQITDTSAQSSSLSQPNQLSKPRKTCTICLESFRDLR